MAKFHPLWNTGHKFDVKLSANGHLVGKDYHIVASAIGCLARVGASFPVHAESWKKIEPEDKLGAWIEVQVSEVLLFCHNRDICMVPC